MDLQCPENTVFQNLCSLRMLKGTLLVYRYTKSVPLSIRLKVYRFENLPIPSSPSEKSMLKISH